MFPAWPRAWDAEFRLLARGGFVVTAAIRGGEVQTLTVESRRGETCRLRNPWAETVGVAAETDNGAVPIRLENGIACFETEVGGVYRLRRRLLVASP